MKDGFTPHLCAMRRKAPSIQKLHKSAGFTLVETLVVVAITLFLSGLLFTYNRSTDNQVVLAAEQARVAGILFRAKSFALQKNVRYGEADACGFGVRFEIPRAMTLFKDVCPANYEYDEGDEDLETIMLNGRVEFFDENRLVCDQNRLCYVIFESPYLVTHNTGTIALRLVGTGDEREVVVGEGGYISTP